MRSRRICIQNAIANVWCITARYSREPNVQFAVKGQRLENIHLVGVGSRFMH